MTSTFANAQLIGFVGSLPEKRISQNGKYSLTFHLGTHQKKMDNTYSTHWHSILITNNFLVTFCAENIKKGDFLFIEGSIEYTSYQNDKNINIKKTNIVISPIAGTLKVLSKKSLQTNENTTYDEIIYNGEEENEIHL